MARLVIGTSKAKTVPAMVKEVGIIPTGTINITQNGTVDVTQYASADVNTPAAPESYRAFKVDNIGQLSNSTTTPWIPLPVGTKTIGPGVLYQAYKDTHANVLSGVIDLSSLTYLSSSVTPAMFETFKGCYGITGVLFTNLGSVGGASNQIKGCFQNCYGITSLSFPVLKTVSATNSAFEDCFNGCTNLAVVDMPLLESIGGKNDFFRTFSGCISLTTMKFQSLKTLSSMYSVSECFRGCTSLQSIWFYALNYAYNANDFNNMLLGVTGCTVHFPISIQSAIGSWSSVTGGFGGTDTIVLFDLVTSLIGADTNTYTRSEKDSTATATAWTYNDTLYYTNGVSNHTAGVHEPTVGTTIYSDAACTTTETTVSAIA